jgi:hypothetical protein
MLTLLQKGILPLHAVVYFIVIVSFSLRRLVFHPASFSQAPLIIDSSVSGIERLALHTQRLVDVLEVEVVVVVIMNRNVSGTSSFVIDTGRLVPLKASDSRLITQH